MKTLQYRMQCYNNSGLCSS